MVLAASFEFNRQYNQEVVERPSDNEQIPRVRVYLNYSFIFYIYFNVMLCEAQLNNCIDWLVWRYIK